MAKILNIPRFLDERGALTVLDNIDKALPFPVRRVFFINAETDAVRGGHRHHVTRQAVICIKGTCVVTNHDGKKQTDFSLDDPGKCLLLETGDWHVMHSFTPHTILLIFASHSYDPADYIYEPYKELVNAAV